MFLHGDSSMVIYQSFFRAKRLWREPRNRIFTLVFGDQTSFRAKGLRGQVGIAIFRNFWRSHFIWCEGLRGTLEIVIYLKFLAIEKIDPKKLKVFLASPNETTGLPEIRLKKWSLSKETQTVQNEKKCCDAKKNSQWMCPTPFYRGSHNLGLCLA